MRWLTRAQVATAGLSATAEALWDRSYVQVALVDLGSLPRSTPTGSSQQLRIRHRLSDCYS
jgi:hypothetical protein